MAVYEGRAVWANSTSANVGAWVDIKEIGGRICLSVTPSGQSSREAFLGQEQARCLARQLYAIARMADKRKAADQ